ncbi:Forkhead box protein K2 [Dimargaris verticillata]|uniref:Forkhead box protein K2 n=1 Tax=Dimargaris verticillata TaxID=2761393 RepID=A0A9W8ECH5_9FUNG|nr:Forkhead box protein K2 [Dimargaris verticillata]
MWPLSVSGDTTASWSDQDLSATRKQAGTRIHRRANRPHTRSTNQDTASTTPTASKPTFTYASMIAQAIMKDPDQIAPVHDIYRYVKEQYPKLCQGSDNPDKWRDTTRHTLTMNRGFVRATILNQQGVRRSGWVVKADYLHCFVNGVFKLPKLRNTTPKSRQFTLYHPQRTRSSREGMGTASPLSTPTLSTASDESCKAPVVAQPRPTYIDTSITTATSNFSPSTSSSVSCESDIPTDAWHYGLPSVDAGSCSASPSWPHESFWLPLLHAANATRYHDVDAGAGGNAHRPSYTASAPEWRDRTMGQGFRHLRVPVDLPTSTGAFDAETRTCDGWGQGWSKLDLLAYVATL